MNAKRPKLQPVVLAILAGETVVAVGAIYSALRIMALGVLIIGTAIIFRIED